MFGHNHLFRHNNKLPKCSYTSSFLLKNNTQALNEQCNVDVEQLPCQGLAA